MTGNQWHRPPPLDPRRSLRSRRKRLPSDDYANLFSFSSDEEDDARWRKSAPHPSFSSAFAGSMLEKEDAVKPLEKRMRVSGCGGGGGGGAGSGSGGSGHQAKNAVQRSKNYDSGLSLNSPKRTPLPEKKELEAILDRLQRRDTYGAFAEPVDLKELPDYHEVIEHPMDFGTIRKKLTRKAYRTFEQFEDDVFLICSNAMQYNTSDTIYFRQARAIECMARKRFQIVRSNSKLAKSERTSEEKSKSSSTKRELLSLNRAKEGLLVPDISSSASRTTRTRLNTSKANTVEKLATFDGLSTIRVNSVKKATGADKLSMTQTEILEKPAAANGLTMTQANALVQPATGLITSLSNDAGKFANGNMLKTIQDNNLEKLQTYKLRMARSKTLAKNATAKGLSMPQVNVVVQPATCNGLSTSQPNGAEKLTNGSGLLTTVANGIGEPTNANGLSMAQANNIPKCATADYIYYNSSFGDTNSVKGANKSEQEDGFSGRSSTLPVGCIFGSRHATALTDIRSNNRLTVLDHGICTNTRSLNPLSTMREVAWKIDFTIAKGSPPKFIWKPILVDENRHVTFNKFDQQQTESDSVFDLFGSEAKQLAAVGPLSDHSYARSMAHFASSLGPLGWEIVAKRIEKALPVGIKFGCGWVGEYEPLPTPVFSFENQKQAQLYGPDLQCTVASKKDEDTKHRAKASKYGDFEEMQLDLKGQVIHGVPHRSGNPGGESNLRGHRSWCGVPTESQPRINNSVLRQQKDHVAVDIVNAKINVLEEVVMCNSPSVNSIPVEEVLTKSEFYPEAQSRTVCAETRCSATNAMLQHHKDLAAADFAKACNNFSDQSRVCNSSSVSSIPVETALRRLKFHLDKQRWFGVSAETQPRSTNTLLQLQKNQVTIDFTKACNDVSEKIGVHHTSSIGSTPFETAVLRGEPHPQAQKKGCLGAYAEAPQSVTHAMLQKHKEQVSADFSKAYSNNVSEQIRVHNSYPMGSIPVETVLQRTECRFDVATSRPLGMISVSNSKVLSRPQKQPDEVTLQGRTASLGLSVGELADKIAGSSANGRANTSFELFSNNQSGEVATL